MPLTDTLIKTLKPAPTPKKHSDGGGLHLLVSPQGSKLWRLAYRCEGKQKTLALGAYPIVSLAEARQKRDGAKKLLASGIDPSQQAKTDKRNRLALTANTFGSVADEFLAKVEREGMSSDKVQRSAACAILDKPPNSTICLVGIFVGMLGSI